MRDGRYADDGATVGSFDKKCECCAQQHPGLVWLWEQRKWLCPICAVAAAYTDAIQEVSTELKTFIESQVLDPWSRHNLGELSKKIAARLQVKRTRNLGG